METDQEVEDNQDEGQDEDMTESEAEESDSKEDEGKEDESESQEEPEGQSETPEEEPNKGALVAAVGDTQKSTEGIRNSTLLRVYVKGVRVLF